MYELRLSGIAKIPRNVLLRDEPRQVYSTGRRLDLGARRIESEWCDDSIVE